MKALCGIIIALLPLTITLPDGDEKKSDDGFVPMFNGKDLTGWVNVNCAPGTFYVKDNEIITTGKPTGYLRTTKQYENFIAEFEWMHVPPSPGAVGNSGFFVWADPIPAVGTGYTRGIEVQVLVNLTYKNKKGEITATSQGDLFSIHGATCVPDRPHPDGWARCLPSENHCKGEKEWNHYRVEANDGVLKLTVNGHLVSGLTKCNPRKGHLALESEGSECHFRNLKIKELPSTNPQKEEIAGEAAGHKPLFFGELTGWKADEAAIKHWQPKDTVLHFDGKGDAKDNALRHATKPGLADWVIDFRFPAKEAKPCAIGFNEQEQGKLKLHIDPDGRFSIERSLNMRVATDAGRDALKPAGQWNRLVVTTRPDPAQKATEEVTFAVNGKRVWTELRVGSPIEGPLVLQPEAAMDFANLFVRPLEKK